MRKLLLALLAITSFIAACDKDDESPSGNSFRAVTVDMGSNSLNDVYYSMSDGEVSTVPRADWDLGFSVPLQSATILINEGAGVELYCVGDTGAWESVDAGTAENFEKRYNNESDWNQGAFNVNASGFPNYGWGTYHFNTDHNVGGDSMYVIKLTDGNWKKFMVRVKLGISSSNVLRWADLNGENEITAAFSTTPYFDKKHFIHFSLVDNKVVEAEPDMTEWDLLFTRYTKRIQAGPVVMDYSVMGVLSNPDVTVAKLTGKDPEKATLADVSGGYSENADAIGFDWKAANPPDYQITIVDSTGYFVKSVDGKTYLLYFTGYGGDDEGTISFKVKNVE